MGLETLRSAAVIGNGAVGVAIAARLRVLGCEVQFLGRREPAQNGVRFEGWGQSFWFDVHTIKDAKLANVQAIFFAVKAYDLKGALKRYLPYFPKNVPIIPVGNGNVEAEVREVASQHSNFKWRIGYCTFGVSVVSPGNYQLMSKVGKVLWGPFFKVNGAQTEFEAALVESDGGRFFEILDPVLPNLRKKWLYNVAMNSLSAKHGLANNGELITHMEELKAVFEEVFLLGNELFGGWEHEKSRMFEEMLSLISAVAKNENSMARDIRDNKKPESLFLAGLAAGKHQFPLLQKLHKDIMSKANYESNREPPKSSSENE